MNIGNRVKLGGVHALKEQSMNISGEKIILLLNQIKVSIMLLEHGLRFEKGRDAIQVSQGIGVLRTLHENVVQKCKDLGISI